MIYINEFDIFNDQFIKYIDQYDTFINGCIIWIDVYSILNDRTPGFINNKGVDRILTPNFWVSDMNDEKSDGGFSDGEAWTGNAM